MASGSQSIGIINVQRLIKVIVINNLDDNDLDDNDLDDLHEQQFLIIKVIVIKVQQ